MFCWFYCSYCPHLGLAFRLLISCFLFRLVTTSPSSRAFNFLVSNSITFLYIVPFFTFPHLASIYWLFIALSFLSHYFPHVSFCSLVVCPAYCAFAASLPCLLVSRCRAYYCMPLPSSFYLSILLSSLFSTSDGLLISPFPL